MKTSIVYSIVVAGLILAISAPAQVIYNDIGSHVNGLDGRHDGLALQVHRMLGFIGQMGAAVFHLGKVAEETGTSPRMIKKNYLSRAAISRATAEEWFSL